ncbi:MAG: sugar phosphate isomerase/epimerase [Chloroflexi bacterium HGW-Chloroflexi-10]|nr:MAG: sugar phosphate isomerase/epimerase [Chloroflexi bacterium HGW-Chloroflexi-10]
MKPFPLKIGTTSYIIPDDILPNVQFLASQVCDVELVLFEVDDGPNNLPDEATLLSLSEIAGQHQLTYTVHLPLDLRLGDAGDTRHVSLQKAQKVIDCTHSLNPFAYVLHLDGRELLPTYTAEAYQKWISQACRALEITANWAGSAELLAVENLEGYPLGFWEPVFERLPVSRCVDIGHLWLDQHDPLPVLNSALPRTRVIHLHGIHTRDHQSLSFITTPQTDAVIHFLAQSAFDGVVTLEVFNQSDFESSLQVVQDSLERYKNTQQPEHKS